MVNQSRLRTYGLVLFLVAASYWSIYTSINTGSSPAPNVPKPIDDKIKPIGDKTKPTDTKSKPEPKKPVRKKVILGWNEILITGYEQLMDFSGCPVSDCEFTFDKERLDEADAVILYTAHFWKSNVKPPKRRADQVWIMFTIESPYITDGLVQNINFNWTMTYRRDADIPYIYDKPPLLPGPVTKKNGTVMWMAANCQTVNKRIEYIQELQKYIPVDCFGGCLHNKDYVWLDGKQLAPKGRMGYLWQENDDVYRAYKFYLSFENCNCHDYVTEKYWKPLRLGTTPVIMGTPNIEEFEPYPGTVIKQSDFNEPKDLAAYLHLLDKNDDLYMKHHRWRSMPREKLNPSYQEMLKMRPACTLCKKLHDPIVPKTIPDDKVWSPLEECEPPIEKWNFS